MRSWRERLRVHSVVAYRAKPRRSVRLNGWRRRGHERRIPHEADRLTPVGFFHRAIATSIVPFEWLEGAPNCSRLRVPNGRVFDPREHRDGCAEVPRGSATHGDAALKPRVRVVAAESTNRWWTPRWLSDVVTASSSRPEASTLEVGRSCATSFRRPVSLHVNGVTQCVARMTRSKRRPGRRAHHQLSGLGRRAFDVTVVTRGFQPTLVRAACHSWCRSIAPNAEERSEDGQNAVVTPSVAPTLKACGPLSATNQSK